MNLLRVKEDSMLNNVKDFEAVGDGVTDDLENIKEAIRDAVVNNKGGILFPPGTYRVSRDPVTSSRWSIDLDGVKDFMIMGEGPKSVVKLVDTTAATGDWHVFMLRNGCQRVVFRAGFMMHGNVSVLTARSASARTRSSRVLGRVLISVTIFTIESVRVFDQFAGPEAEAQLDRMLLLQADVTAHNDADRALLKRFSLFGPPGIIFFDAEGR
jgi:hypothetical protein